MQVKIKMPRGTVDILPNEIYKWKYIEEKLSKTASAFNYKEIRTPVFEHTELFTRGVGDTTDIVQKEMYTFCDKAGRSITLRPEGTASIARSVVENGLYSGALPLKFFYNISCFRYEKPQAGRLREFRQFGVELYGNNNPMSDVEVISLANEMFLSLGITDLSLEINSIGCKKCRIDYQKALVDYFNKNIDVLCGTCKDRLSKNPMRILDCKNHECIEVCKNAPRVIDYLCDDCKTHFESVKKGLDNIGINYSVNPKIVRGLDYYIGIVFEFVSAANTVCGGGRYDGLISELGGPELSGLGFAIGLNRLVSLLEEKNIKITDESLIDLYIAPVGSEAADFALKKVTELRRCGVCAETDLMSRSVKAQMKYADKLGAEHVMVIGSDEINRNTAKIRSMKSDFEQEINFDELCEFFSKK